MEYTVPQNESMDAARNFKHIKCAPCSWVSKITRLTELQLDKHVLYTPGAWWSNIFKCVKYIFTHHRGLGLAWFNVYWPLSTYRFFYKNIGTVSSTESLLNFYFLKVSLIRNIILKMYFGEVFGKILLISYLEGLVPKVASVFWTLVLTYRAVSYIKVVYMTRCRTSMVTEIR